jgi:hypothetical protein
VIDLGKVISLKLEVSRDPVRRILLSKVSLIFFRLRLRIKSRLILSSKIFGSFIPTRLKVIHRSGQSQQDWLRLVSKNEQRFGFAKRPAIDGHKHSKLQTYSIHPKAGHGSAFGFDLMLVLTI